VPNQSPVATFEWISFLQLDATFPIPFCLSALMATYRYRDDDTFFHYAMSVHSFRVNLEKMTGKIETFGTVPWNSSCRVSPCPWVSGMSGDFPSLLSRMGVVPFSSRT
jgi:hypothetical protein